MKKTLAALLCLLMLGTAGLAACNDNGGNSSDSPSTAVSSAQSDANSEAANNSQGETSVDENGWVDGIKGYLGDGKWGRGMPEFIWDKDTFTVLVYNNTKQTTYFSEEIEPDLYETTDAVINEAVAKRNREIEERFGVKIKARAVDDVYTTLTAELQASDPENADAAMPFLSMCTTLAQNGQLFDLKTFEEDGYIDLSMPWWDQNANASLSIADKVYFSISDMSIMQKINSFCVMFNKDLLATKHPELDLYEEVRNKTWTVDKMLELSKEFTYESDGVDGLSADDNWGFISANNDVLWFYLSSGARLVTKDSDDKPVLSLGVDERSINIAQQALTMLEEKDTWCILAEDIQTDRWNKVVQMIGENKALFRCTAFSAVKKVRAYDANFGLIPFPLLDDTQDDYYTPCSGAYGIVIPLSAPEPEYSAFMLDLISATSKGENDAGLTRAYTEVVLKGKDLDEESGEMLDNYIFANIVYDPGVVYDFGIRQMFADLMSKNSSEIVSALDSNRDSIITKIDEIVDLYTERT